MVTKITNVGNNVQSRGNSRGVYSLVNLYTVAHLSFLTVLYLCVCTVVLIQ